jgi:hypothetical protein
MIERKSTRDKQFKSDISVDGTTYDVTSYKRRVEVFEGSRAVGRVSVLSGPWNVSSVTSEAHNIIQTALRTDQLIRMGTE